jgi:hypothetical protein
MSTENTSQKDLIHKGYPLITKSQDFIESEEIKRLVLAFEDDPTLRNFFIRQQFVKLFSKNTKKNDDQNGENKDKDTYLQLFNFIKESHLLPLFIPEKATTNYYTHISKLSNSADKFFTSKLNRSLAHVCEKALKIGIIEPDIIIDPINGKEIENFVLLCDESGESTYRNFHLSISGRLCFYNISKSLYEIWIKTEDTGLFLEIWIYHILKEHLKKYDNIDVIHGVEVMNKGLKTIPNDITALIESDRSTCEISRITEFDILITKDNNPICVIECKTSEAKMPDVLKLYGVTQLLNIHNVVLITNKFGRFKGVTKFEYIHIITDIIEDTNFPLNLLDIVERFVQI